MGELLGESAFAAAMDREILACLAELGGPKVVAGHKVTSPNTDYQPHTEPDAVEDPLNSAAVGADVNHRVTIAPAPPGLVNNVVTPEVVWNVPETPARATIEINAVETVIHTASGTDAGFASFLNVTKSANSSARRSGSLAASVAHTLGPDAAATQEGSPLALATRITSAKLAAAQGATASAAPSAAPIDVIWGRLSNVGDLEELYADHHSVYLPSSLNPGCMSALLSLLVEGGPAAYTWRYRPTIAPDGTVVPDPRDGYMPSVTRHLHSGGQNRLLALTELDVLLPAVGGASLTYNNLDALENHYRVVWGHDTFDAAWRSTFASAGVYLAPVRVQDAHIKPGEHFDLYATRHTHRRNDLHGDIWGWTGRQTPDAVGAFTNVPVDGGDWRGGGRDEREIGLLGWRCAQAVRQALPAAFNQVVVDATGFVFVFRPVGGRADQELIIDWAEIFQGINRLTRRQGRKLRAASLLYANQEMGDALEGEPDDQGHAIDSDTIWRNVYGARDHVRVSLARLRMFEVVGLIAHYTVPTRRVASHSGLTRGQMYARAANYAGHLHLLNFFSFFKHDFWPCDIKTYGHAHSAYLRDIPAYMRPYCWMGRIEPDAYPEQNWLVLESGYILRGSQADSPFVGHNVAGTWEKRTDGIVKLNSQDTHLAALEAAFRYGIHEGGVYSADGRFGATHFCIVRGQSGLSNPMAFAPRIHTVRGTAGVSLMHDTGPSTLQAGVNATVPIVAVR